MASIPATPLQLAGIFVTTVLLRNVLESAGTGGLFSPPAFIYHFPIAYVFPMLVLSLILHALSGYPLRGLLKLMVFAWTLTLLPPVIDFIAGTSQPIGYFPLDRLNAEHFLVNFFNPAVDLVGTTTGIRLEAALGCILAGVFTASVSRRLRLIRGGLTIVVMAVVFLLFFTFPFLAYLLTCRIFPYADQTQLFYQWHVSSLPHLTGGAHYSVFLLDVWPVSVAALLAVRLIRKDRWSELASHLGSSLHGLVICLAGTAAALLSACRFSQLAGADLISISGALLAALGALLSRAWTGKWKLAMAATALFVASAVGWPTLVLVALGLASSLLPGPPGLRGVILYPSLLLAAASPVIDPFLSPGILAAAAAAALAGLLVSVRPLSVALALATVAAAVALGPVEPSSPVSFWKRINRGFSSSSRPRYSLVASAHRAARGEGFRSLAESSHLIGTTERARWAYGIALANGDSTADILKVGINLAVSEASDRDFALLLDRYLRACGDAAPDGLIEVAASRAGARGDTAMLSSIHERIGPSPLVYREYSRALLALGDSTQAVSYADLATVHPHAGPEDFAWAIGLRAARGLPYDSTYRRGDALFPSSMPIMLARLRAPLLWDEPPDRERLLDECLALEPGSPRVLEVAALWSYHAERPESALAYAERYIASSPRPAPSAMEIACQTSLELGLYHRAEVHSRYAAFVHPDQAFFHLYRAAALGAMGRRQEARESLAAAGGLRPSSALLDSLCREISR
jgi:tetratricopeptide (TPR) repeat protein